MKILGIDEVGRGSVAGPLVLGGCVFKDVDDEYLRKIKDSKKLTPKKREEIFEYLKQHSYCTISIISNIYIDEHGISAAIKKGVREVYDVLKDKADITIFDGNWDPILEQGFITKVNADESIKEVSAASIIAKVSRDRIMSEHYAQQYPQYLFEKHKGYGTKEHRDLIKQYGRCEIHRKSFKIRGYD